MFKAFLDEQGLDRPHVAGNSLGGRIALEAGANGHARSVTALSPAGFWRTEPSFALHPPHLHLGRARSSSGSAPRADRLARSRAGRRLVYGALMSHPARVPCDHALGDIRGFRRSLPALRALLDAATPFTGEIAAERAGDDRLGRPRPGAAAVAGRGRPACLPHAEHLMMRGVGHVPMFDDPKHVARHPAAGQRAGGRRSPPLERLAARPAARAATA